MLARHNLVWLSADGWDEVRHALPVAEQSVCQAWQASDWPLVVRRQLGAPGRVGLGLALPPNQGAPKSKLTLSCYTTGIVRETDPLSLSVVVESAPEAWRADMLQLANELAGHDIQAYVYGSLSWEALTGQAYLGPNSDIDLSLPILTHAQLTAVGIVLQASSLPLDGELLFPMQQAVAWKEWFLTDSDRVLVKQEQAYLCPRERLLELLT
jgi:phosphoribosyl-dephospho-CoA transferase